MTNEEFERAVDFILKSQARAETRLERAEERQAQMDELFKQLAERLDSFADTQANIMRVMTRTFESQAQINESLRAAIVELATRQSRTEESLSRLAEAQITSDRRLGALIKFVEERRDGG